MYVDDVLAGSDSLEDALEIKIQTEQLLQAGGFSVSKWTGSYITLGPNSDGAQRLFSEPEGVGALGILWIKIHDSPDQDILSLRISLDWVSIKVPTKRLVLASIARTFDLAGWAAPMMVTAKILLQDIWKADMDWDQELLEPLKSWWARLAKDVPELVNVRIPRWTGILARKELHVFADASENAYAATVYLRGFGPSGEWQSSLLVAKTKIAPLKLKSIPRLELCGALLVARLLQRVADGLHIEKEVRYAWSDARVVLAWIKAHPSRWATFVVNRVAAIQELIPEDRWRYVST